MTVPDPNEADLEAFWVDARIHAKLNQLAAYMGPTSLDTLRPPTSYFGGTAAVADELADLIVAGTKTATSGALWDYEAGDEPLPEVGDLEIVLDGSGRPRALITMTEVAIAAFAEVDAEFAAAEGEGDRSLGHWRRVHEDFFTTYAEHDRGFDPSMPLVLQRFRVLYAVERHAP